MPKREDKKMRNNVAEYRTVRPADAKVEIKHLISKQRPVMIWGPPGIGKSEIVDEIGIETTRNVIDLRLLLMEPTDLRGIPFYNQKTGKMEWAPSSDLPTDPNSTDILFLDEINAAPQSVQAAAYQLILNRKIGAYTLPKGCAIVAAGNRESDRGVTYRMPSPLANRFVHIEMAPNFEDWQTWATGKGIHADVVGYLTFAKSDLYDFDPRSSSRGFATPRSWTFVSELIDDEMPESILTDMIAGSVGEGLAVKFQAHRKLSSKMPNPSDILKGKVKSLKDKDVSAMYSLTTALTYELKDLFIQAEKSKKVKEWHNYADTYLGFLMDNMEPEMVILGIRSALKAQLPFSPKELKNFDRFYKRYGNLLSEIQ